MHARSLRRRAVAAFAIVVMVLGVTAGTSMARSSFPDVPPGSYYATPVEWMENWGITTGIGDTGRYGPDEVVTRAQLVTFLWRMAGSPTGNPPHGFTDVPSNSYYAEAARWARAENITTGVGGGFGGSVSTTFAPFDSVTRAQAFTFLWRYGGEPTGYPAHGFTDVRGNTYYEGPARWARGEGITTGLGGTQSNPTKIFAPNVPLTRAQMAALIHRYAGAPAPHQQGNTAPGAWVTTPPEEPPEEPPAPTVNITAPTSAAQITVDQGDSFEVSFTTNVAVDYTVDLGDDELDTGSANAGTTTVDVDIPADFAAGEHDLTVTVESEGGNASDTEADAVLVLPSDGVFNVRTSDVSDTIGEALDDEDFQADDTLLVTADHLGTVLLDEPVEVRSMGASLAGSFHVTADDVTIDNFEITDFETVMGEVVGIYLQDVANIAITNNVITGEGTGRGILTTLTGTETGTIDGNTITDVTTGIGLQGNVQLSITGNQISDSTAGIGSDTTADAAVTVTGNIFTDNAEGIGLGGPGVTIGGNTFEITAAPADEVYVEDWTADRIYDLVEIRDANTFDPTASVIGKQIVPAPAVRVDNITQGLSYLSLQDALDAADEGDELHAFGTDTDGVVLIDKSVTLRSTNASLAGSFHVAADDVTIDGFEITDIETVLGEVVGIYLQGVADVAITNNVITGDGAGVGISTTVPETETGTIDGNTITNVTTGIFLNGDVQLTITGNTMSDSTVGIGSDTNADAAVTVSDNIFTDNSLEGIGLNGPGLTIEDNTFNGEIDDVYVALYPANGGAYDLDVIRNANTFDPTGYVFQNQIVAAL